MEKYGFVGKIGAQLLKTLQPKDRPFHVRDTDLKGFLLRVQPTGVMTYIFEYRTPNGRKPRIKIARVGTVSPLQARDRAKDIAADVVKGNDPQSKKALTKVPTMERFLKGQYEPWITSSRKTGAATIARLRSTFSFLLHSQLTAISAWHIEQWRTKRIKEGITKQTTNRGFVSIKAMFNKAVEWGVVTENPLQKLKAYRVDSNPRTRYLTPEEEARLAQAFIDRENEIRAGRERGNHWRRTRNYELYPSLERRTFVDHLRPMVIISKHTGLRRGSLTHLRKEDVDLVARKITVPAAYAKAERTYRVPLNQECWEVINTWMQENVTNPSPWLFPSADGKPIRDPKNAWKKVLAKAKIENFRWHDLRHTFASKLVMTGVPLNTVRVLLDHSHPLMTARYSHLSEDATAAAVAKLCEVRPATSNSTQETKLAVV